MTMPSANEVAWAIVAACRETQESIEDVMSRQPAMRARHYALHALSRVSPDAPKDCLARAVGCPGDGLKFWHNSVQQKFKMMVGGPRVGKRLAKWWDEDAFERVIAAVPRVTEPKPDIEIDPDPVPARAPPIKLSAKVGSIVEPTRPVAAPGKRKLEDMLREAVHNTQRMTPPPEEL